jgi:hypothetical protein
LIENPRVAGSIPAAATMMDERNQREKPLVSFFLRAGQQGA